MKRCTATWNWRLFLARKCLLRSIFAVPAPTRQWQTFLAFRINVMNLLCISLLGGFSRKSFACPFWHASSWWAFWGKADRPFQQGDKRAIVTVYFPTDPPQGQLLSNAGGHCFSIPLIHSSFFIYFRLRQLSTLFLWAPRAVSLSHRRAEPSRRTYSPLIPFLLSNSLFNRNPRPSSFADKKLLEPVMFTSFALNTTLLLSHWS